MLVMVGAALAVILFLPAGSEKDDSITYGQFNSGTEFLSGGIRSGAGEAMVPVPTETPVAEPPQAPEAQNEASGEIGIVDSEPESNEQPPEPPEPPPPSIELSGRGAVICAVFSSFCGDALAVAECESGYAPDGTPDYSDTSNPYHVGPFQLSYRYHADKFAAHGWDMYTEGDDAYKNSTIALEIFTARGYTWLGTQGWPNCGWEAGY